MSTGRFLLRLPATLHRRLTARAGQLGLSLNEFCVRKLGGPEAVGLADPAALAIREQAETVAGARLVGIVVHGSWARGEAGKTSDVDVLVIVESSLPLTRALYRTWDGEALTWGGRPVDAHFLHLPAEPERAGGVWCEAAVDGIVLHDPEGRVEPVLRRIRRAIADRRLVRKRTHGQPYWTAAA